jgi:hypothetical protein
MGCYNSGPRRINVEPGSCGPAVKEGTDKAQRRVEQLDEALQALTGSAPYAVRTFPMKYSRFARVFLISATELDDILAPISGHTKH